MNKKKLTVAVINWNACSALRHCLKSIAAHPYHGASDVLVVDNGSEDGSADMVRSDFPWTRLLANRENLGFAGACNQAVKAADSELILFLNSDIRVLPGSLDAMAECMEGEPAPDICGGHLTDSAGETQKGFTIRRFPTPLSLIFELLLVDKIFPGNRISRRYRMSDWDYQASGEVDQPAGACLLIRREVFDRIGGMDPDFHPAWFEDVDFCRRAKKAGFRIYFNHRARFLHEGGASVSVLSREGFLPLYYRNLERYCRKHFSRPVFYLIKFCVIIGMLKRIVWMSLIPVFRKANKTESLSAFLNVLKGSLSGWKNQSPFIS